MTYTSTHIGISSILFLLIAPRDLKQKLKEHPFIALFITLGAIVPDVDLFFGSHRSWSHSVFLVVLAALLVNVIFSDLVIRFVASFRERWRQYLLERDSSDSPRYKHSRLYLNLFVLLWFSHLLFDLTFGSLQLFYPIDTRFYDFILGIVIDLEGNALLPITISGFFVSVQVTDQISGSSSYFVNWTAEQRINYFGSDSYNLAITNFVLHVFIFSWWVIKFLIPVLVLLTGKLLSKGNLENSLRDKAKKIRSLATWRLIPEINWRFVFIFLVIVVSAYYAGPHFGKEWEQTRRTSDQVYILSDQFKLLGNRNFNNPDENQLDVIFSMGKSSIPFTAFIMEVDEEEKNEILQTSSELLNEFKDGNITILQYFEQYIAYIQSKVGITNTRSVDANTTASWEFSSTNNLQVLIGLYSWNTSQFFIRSFSSEALWVIAREDAYWLGLYTSIFSLSAIMVVVSIDVRRFLRKNP